MGLFLVDEFCLIFFELALDDFLYQVNGYVHICALLFGTDNMALHRDGHFDFLAILGNAQSNDGLCILVKIPFQFSDLLNNCCLLYTSVLRHFKGKQRHCPCRL